MAIVAAVLFTAGIYPGLAGYDGPPPPNPPPRVKAHRQAEPKPPMTIATVLEKLKQKLEHRAEARVSPPSSEG